MKKLFCIPMFFIFVSALVFSIQAKAEELLLLESRITEDEIYYEVYGEVFQSDAVTPPVTKYIEFEGRVTPPAQYPWRETVNGIKYSGVLTLSRYGYMKKDNITTAVYTGTLNYNSYQ